MSADLRYAAVACDTYYGPAREVLLSLPGRDETVVVGREVALVLDQCGPPRTMEGHAAHLSKALAAEDPAALRAVLESLIDVGLVTAYDPPSSSASPSSRPIDVVTIPTCDRPALAGRCVASWTAHCERWGHAPTFVVVETLKSVSIRSLGVVEAGHCLLLTPASGEQRVISVKLAG
jgi:hypothetical protein